VARQPEDLSRRAFMKMAAGTAAAAPSINLGSYRAFGAAGRRTIAMGLVIETAGAVTPAVERNRGPETGL